MKQALIRSGLLTCIIIIGVVSGCTSQKPGPGSQAPKVTTFTAKDGLPNDQITALAVFGGQIWVGTKGGIARHDGVNWEIFVTRNKNCLGSDIIEGFFVGPKALWISTEKGVCKNDGTNWNSVLTGTRGRSVAAKPANAATGGIDEIAIATAHGIEYSTGGEFSPFGKDSGLIYEEVNAVAFDGKGLWVGTRAGMGLFQGGRFSNFTGPQKEIMGNSLVDKPPSPPNCKLVGNNINVIIPYRGMLAIGTTSGLSITDMENQWTNYQAPHKDWVQRADKIVEELLPGNCPLPGNSIRALAAAPADTALFVGTDRGIGILQGNTWTDVAAKIPDLRSGPVSAVAMENDNLWIGTPNGLVKVAGVGSILQPDTK